MFSYLFMLLYFVQSICRVAESPHWLQSPIYLFFLFISLMFTKAYFGFPL